MFDIGPGNVRAVKSDISSPFISPEVISAIHISPWSSIACEAFGTPHGYAEIFALSDPSSRKYLTDFPEATVNPSAALSKEILKTPEVKENREAAVPEILYM